MGDFPDAGRDIQVGITTPKYRAGWWVRGAITWWILLAKVGLDFGDLLIYKFSQQSTQVSKPGDGEQTAECKR